MLLVKIGINTWYVLLVLVCTVGPIQYYEYGPVMVKNININTRVVNLQVFMYTVGPIYYQVFTMIPRNNTASAVVPLTLLLLLLLLTRYTTSIAATTT